MNQKEKYIDRIMTYYPSIVINQVDMNLDGFTNDIVIVNKERVFRYAHDEAWMRESLAREARILGILRDCVDMPVPQYEVHAEDCVSYPFLKGQLNE